MKKRTIKTICITAGAIVAVGAGITAIACVLAKKKKEGTITPEELKEQDKLRKEYIKLFREGFKSQLKAIKVVDEKGNDITPLKLKQEKLKN